MRDSDRARGAALEVRRLLPDDAERFVELRFEALEREPLAFASSPEDDVGAVVEEVRRRLAEPDAPTFGAFAPELAGCVGAYRDRHLKARHKVHVWGMYVRPAARRAGVARALLEAVLGFARSQGALQVHLSVSERAPEARRLYESLGFECWGTEPRALQHAGEWAAEHHMVLRLPA